MLTGHVHLYARTCSVKRDKCVGGRNGGITHITLGALVLSMLFRTTMPLHHMDRLPMQDRLRCSILDGTP